MTGAFRPLPCRRCGSVPCGPLEEMIGEHLVALKLQCGRGCIGGVLRRELTEASSLSPREVLRRRRAGTLPNINQARDSLVRRAPAHTVSGHRKRSALDLTRVTIL